MTDSNNSTENGNQVPDTENTTNAQGTMSPSDSEFERKETEEPEQIDIKESETVTSEKNVLRIIPNNEYKLSNTPYIPNDVYVKIPELLKQATTIIDDLREKDLILTSSIVILGGCLGNVHGYYNGDTVYPTYSFSA
jgi:hypothetical protein